jgi:hypothetical protein
VRLWSLCMQSHFEITNASLEVLNEALSKFGGLMTESHAMLRDALLPVLEESRSGLRKRAVHCMGEMQPPSKPLVLSVCLSEMQALETVSSRVPEP